MKNIEKSYKTLMIVNIVLIVLVVALGIYTFVVKDSLGIGDDIGLSPGSSVKVLAKGTQDDAFSGQIINTESKVNSRSQLCLVSGSGATSSTSCIAKRNTNGQIEGASEPNSMLFWNDAKGGDFIFGNQLNGKFNKLIHINKSENKVGIFMGYSSPFKIIYDDHLGMGSIYSPGRLDITSDSINIGTAGERIFLTAYKTPIQGNAYLCIASTGRVYRSPSPCN